MPLRHRRTIPPVVLLLLLVLSGAARAGAAGAPADSAAGALADPFAPALAPTVCVVPEDLDPRAVRRLLDEQVAAWNRGDLEGFMRGYWRSDSLTFYSGGSVTHGWRTTLERYRARYQGGGREMGTLAFDVHDVSLPARGLAVVRGGWSLAMKEGRPSGLFTLLLRWFEDDGWRVVHDHSSAAQQAAPAGSP